MSDERAQGTTGASAVPEGTRPVAGSRIVPLEVGQRVQATVVALGARGRVVVGLLGGQVEARTERPLQVGRTYDLVVRSVHPEIRLAGAPAATGPAAPRDPVTALGPGNAELTQRLAKLVAGVVPFAGRRAEADALSVALARLRRGEPTGVDLRTVVAISNPGAIRQWLAGANHGTSALATGPEDAGGSATARRGGREARSTAAGEGVGAALEVTHGASQREAVGGVLEALGAVDRENANRVRLRAPLWIPLPLADEFAHEGRMFWFAAEPDHEARPTAGVRRPVRLALLLDLVRLGGVRADVEVFEERVSVTLTVAEPRGVQLLDESLGELRSALEAAGLRPDALGVRLAGGSSLPIADLLAPADPHRRGLVDVHV